MINILGEQVKIKSLCLGAIALLILVSAIPNLILKVELDLFPAQIFLREIHTTYPTPLSAVTTVPVGTACPVGLSPLSLLVKNSLNRVDLFAGLTFCGSYLDYASYAILDAEQCALAKPQGYYCSNNICILGKSNCGVGFNSKAASIQTAFTQAIFVPITSIYLVTSGQTSALCSGGLCLAASLSSSDCIISPNAASQGSSILKFMKYFITGTFITQVALVCLIAAVIFVSFLIFVFQKTKQHKQAAKRILQALFLFLAITNFVGGVAAVCYAKQLYFSLNALANYGASCQLSPAANLYIPFSTQFKKVVIFQSAVAAVTLSTISAAFIIVLAVNYISMKLKRILDLIKDKKFINQFIDSKSSGNPRNSANPVSSGNPGNLMDYSLFADVQLKDLKSQLIM